MVWIVTVKNSEKLIVCQTSKEAALTLIDFIYGDKTLSWQKQDDLIRIVEKSYYENNDDFGCELGFAQSYFVRQDRDCRI